MNRAVTFLIVLSTVVWISCKKTTLGKNTTVEAFYSIHVDTTNFPVDSLVAKCLLKDGSLIHPQIIDNYWKSPVMTFKDGDTAFAELKIYGHADSLWGIGPAIYLSEKNYSRLLLYHTFTGPDSTGNKINYCLTCRIEGRIKL